MCFFFVLFSDRAVFEKVLMYVYSGDALVIPAQLIPVYACASRLGLTALADKCSALLATALSPDNVVAVLKIVEGMPALRSVCFKVPFPSLFLPSAGWEGGV